MAKHRLSKVPEAGRLSPGQFRIRAVAGIHWFQAVLPIGGPDGEWFQVPVKRGTLVRDGGEVAKPFWAWDGNEDAPTLMPSIVLKDSGGEDIWHGHVKRGVAED